MLGSAPDVTGQSARGIERTHIRLGVVQPGENIAVFNDVLGNLQGSSSFLYSDGTGNRWWYDTRPTLRKVMEDRAQQLSKSDVEYELEQRLNKWRKCAPFQGLHVYKGSSLDVPDDQVLRLVVLPPSAGHRGNQETSATIKAAGEILSMRGTTRGSTRTCWPSSRATDPLLARSIRPPAPGSRGSQYPTIARR